MDEVEREEVDGEAGPSSPSPLSGCLQRSLRQSLIFLTFSLAFLSGLSLLTAGLFKEYVRDEEIELETTYMYRSRAVALFGLIVLIYSTIGMFLCCSRRVLERVSNFKDQTILAHYKTAR